MQQRRSVRTFVATPLALDEVAQLLWAAQGVTHPLGYRAAPSAGALQPLVMYLVAGNVAGLSPAVYRYLPTEHALVLTQTGDLREAWAPCWACRCSTRRWGTGVNVLPQMGRGAKYLMTITRHHAPIKPRPAPPAGPRAMSMGRNSHRPPTKSSEVARMATRWLPPVSHRSAT